MIDASLWDRLSESAQDALREQALMLANRFTGKIQMDCLDGGVRLFHDTRQRRANELRRDQSP